MTLEVAQSVLGSIDATDISTVVNGIVKRDAAACFTWLSEYVETGADLARFARDLAAYIRDLYVLCLTDGALAVDAPQASRASMAAEAQAFGADRLSYVLRVLGDLNNELRTSTNPRLSFEIALTRMVRPESDLTLEALAARIAALEQLVASGSLPSSAATSVEALRPRESAGNPSVRSPCGFGFSHSQPGINQRRVSSVCGRWFQSYDDARFFDFRVERACSTRDFAASDDAADAGVGSPRIRGVPLSRAASCSISAFVCGRSSRNGDACCCGNG